MFSGLVQKDLFKGKWSLAKSYFKQNYGHACHTRFAVVFPLPSCCVSSLMIVQGSSAYMGYIFHLFSLQVYQREKIHESSSLHALAPLFFLARKEMSAYTLWVEVNWGLCTATPSPQEKNRKRFLFPHFFLREWGGYTVARKTASFFFFTIIIKIDFKGSCQYYWSIDWSIPFLKEFEYPRLLLL